jgi:hypothetical protein
VKRIDLSDEERALVLRAMRHYVGTTVLEGHAPDETTTARIRSLVERLESAPENRS